MVRVCISKHNIKAVRGQGGRTVRRAFTLLLAAGCGAAPAQAVDVTIRFPVAYATEIPPGVANREDLVESGQSVWKQAEPQIGKDLIERVRGYSR